jgi:hypothetical protein
LRRPKPQNASATPRMPVGAATSAASRGRSLTRRLAPYIVSLMASKTEWLGGRYALQQVREGDSAFTPDIILWLELPSGLLVGSVLNDPRKPISLAESLETAMTKPMAGSPRRPSRIRVADSQTARELRDAATGIPIIVASVPELDDTFDQFVEALGEAAPENSYLGDGEVPPRLVAELFKAASLLFRTAPWRRMSDQQILRVDIPSLGIDGACLSVIGAAGESYGLLLFSSVVDYHTFSRQAAGVGDRLALRSLSFSPRDELAPSLVREVEEHHWPVAGPKAYPVVICVTADLNPIPVGDTDVRTMTMVTRAFLAFFARHREIFETDDPEPVRESSAGEDGVEVTLTAPYVALDEDAFKRPPVMREVGRNDPCPCGSGKKYKKCHLDADVAPRRETAAIESVHELDFRLVRQLARFAASRIGPDWLGTDPDEEEEDALELILPWATWTAETNGTRVANLYLEEHARRLSAEEREWVAAQQEAWLSVWEVTAVAPGTIDARDLLTGETRSVREELASRTAVIRDTLLARVIDYRGVSYFGGMHRRPLSPLAAAAVLESARARLRLRKAPVPVARLRQQKIGWFLIDQWTDAVERQSRPPSISNTDGDPVQFVTESFRHDPAARSEIETRLEAMEDFESAAADGQERVHIFVRSSDDTMIGNVIVGEDTLRIETNSENRADALGDRVAAACAGLLRDRERTIEPFSALMARGNAAAEPRDEPSPEEQVVMRELKEIHYRKWLDTPLPALGGKTPHAAMRSAKSRRELDVLLRDIERLESRQPEALRFDVGVLRRDLGLDP